jgi:putative SOS response-associated peptidase YedK
MAKISQKITLSASRDIPFEEGQFEDRMREPPDRAAGMMQPYAGLIDAWQVPAAVGNVTNNGPALIERIEPT